MISNLLDVYVLLRMTLMRALTTQQWLHGGGCVMWGAGRAPRPDYSCFYISGTNGGDDDDCTRVNVVGVHATSMGTCGTELIQSSRSFSH